MEEELYRVEVSGVPNGSEWDIQPSAFPTYDLSIQFALGIGKAILAISGWKAVNDFTLSIIGPHGPVVTWPLDALLFFAMLEGQMDENA